MKVTTAVNRIEIAINANEFIQANAMMNKYRRKFGNRKFTYWMRVMIKNGLWEMGVK
jgi:hypothetical protein